MRPNKKHILSLIILILSTLLISTELMAQSSQITFGKNRVQYKDFDWQFYETDNFRIYFYQGGLDIVKYVVLNSEKLLVGLTKKLDFRRKTAYICAAFVFLGQRQLLIIK